MFTRQLCIWKLLKASVLILDKLLVYVVTINQLSNLVLPALQLLIKTNYALI